MIYELMTASGTTLLSGLTRQRDALQAAALISVANPMETVIVSCWHLGVGSHQVCAMCNGVLRNNQLSA